MKLFYTKIETPFEYPFTISGGRTKTHQPALLVALQLGNYIGFGEAPAITYYNISVEEMIADIEAKKTLIEKFALTDPQRYWHYLHHLLPNNPFLVAALDIACWDLFGKMKGKLLYQLFNTTFTNTPATNYTIGIDSPQKMVQKMTSKPWQTYKIKIGSTQDIELVTELRKHTNANFIVDANAAFTLEEALIIIPQLKNLGVTLVEQPLAKNNWTDMAVLHQQSCLPIFADEACVFEADVAKCANNFSGINIKLTKCSGISPAIRMIEQAKKLGLQVMMGSMNETTVGSAAIANFLPQLDFVDMDGPLLLQQDIATGLQYLPNGNVNILGKAGLGIALNSDIANKLLG
jgi:L-Ala-D/L-Glu epimerase